MQTMQKGHHTMLHDGNMQKTNETAQSLVSKNGGVVFIRFYQQLLLESLQNLEMLSNVEHSWIVDHKAVLSQRNAHKYSS